MADDDSMAKEKIRMYAAIAAAVQAWAEIENALALILHAILKSPHGQMAYAVYYAPTSTETRLSIIDNAIAHLPMVWGDIPRIWACWDQLKLKIDRAKNTRNKIVHGQVMFNEMAGKTYCRLGNPLFDSTKRNDLIEKINNRQVPGMSSNDVETAVTAFRLRTDQAYLLAEIICEMLADDRPGPPGWHKELGELEAGLNLTAARKDAPNPTGQ